MAIAQRAWAPAAPAPRAIQVGEAAGGRLCFAAARLRQRLHGRYLGRADATHRAGDLGFPMPRERLGLAYHVMHAGGDDTAMDGCYRAKR